MVCNNAMKGSLIILVAITVPLVTLLSLPSLYSYSLVDSKKYHKDNINSNDNTIGVNVIFSVVVTPQGSGSTEILTGFNDLNALGYFASSQQVSAAQSFKASNEQTIDNVRQSRLILLEGIDNAIQRLIESEQKTLTEKPIGMFDTTHIAQLLKADHLNTAVQELTDLKTRVINVFGQEAADREVVPQIQNLISALKLQ
jgi:hypothetical protein